MTLSKSLVAMMCFTAASVLMIPAFAYVPEYSAEMKSLFDDAVDVEVDDASQRHSRRLTYWRSKRVRTINIDLNVTNLSFKQPFGRFFVMVHNQKVDPLFTLGMPASDALQELAENGNPAMLVDMYKNNSNVLFADIMGNGPLAAGGRTTLTVPTTYNHQYVTIASMAVNTNDCFVALNGQRILIGAFQSPGYDAGTEENNERCSSIPGPACPADSGNVASGNGEGFVHVHRGFFGISDDAASIRLSEAGYDWRNPMMRVEVDRSMKFAITAMKQNYND